MTSENLCEPSPISWRHWAKFCVSHGGFGAMAPAPLTPDIGVCMQRAKTPR